MGKMWFTMFTNRLLLLLMLHARMLDSVPVVPVTASEDVEYDDFVVFDVLEKALVSRFNVYKLQETFLSDGLTLCLPVTYHIHCEKEADCSNTLNCSEIIPFSQSYLWTLFNTNTFAGKFLLYFTENRLKSPLLGLPDHLCSFSATNGITLYLEVESFPCLQGNVSVEAVISKALVKITGWLDVYAASNGQSPVTVTETPGGYGLRWTSSTEHSFDKQTVYSEYYIPIPLILVAVLIGINSARGVFNFFGRRLKERKTYFLAFWSFQLVIAEVNILDIVYIIKSDPKGAESLVVTLGTLTFVFIYAGCFLLRNLLCGCCNHTSNRETPNPQTLRRATPNKSESVEEIVSLQSEDSDVNIDDIEVPCSCWKCFSSPTELQSPVARDSSERTPLLSKTTRKCSSCKIYTKGVFVFIASVNTFLFFLFLAYTLPWVILGFYLYPIKVLVRIGFLFAAALCLMLNSALTISYIEKLTSHRQDFREGCKNLFGLLTSVFLQIAVLYMGTILYHIVFIFNSHNNASFEELLTILPGLAVYAIAYVIHGKVNVAEILGVEKKEKVKLQYKVEKEGDFVNIVIPVKV